MMIERLRWSAIISFVVALGGLLLGGVFANREAPPYPGKVTGADGTVLFSFKEGLWVARDVSFFERPLVAFCGQLRIVPDTVIIVLGILPLVYFLFTTFPHLKAREIKDDESVWKRLGVDL